MFENFLALSDSWIRTAVLRRPRIYLGLLAIISLFGYAYILLFSTLIVLGAIYLISHYPFVQFDQSGSAVAAWTGLVILSITICHRMLKIRPTLPEGLRVQPTLAIALLEDINQLIPDRGLPFDQVIINFDNDIDIVHTPVCGVPVRFNRTLVIGI